MIALSVSARTNELYRVLTSMNRERASPLYAKRLRLNVQVGCPKQYDRQSATKADGSNSPQLVQSPSSQRLASDCSYCPGRRTRCSSQAPGEMSKRARMPSALWADAHCARVRVKSRALHRCAVDSLCEGGNPDELVHLSRSICVLCRSKETAHLCSSGGVRSRNRRPTVRKGSPTAKEKCHRAIGGRGSRNKERRTLSWVRARCFVSNAFEG